MSSYQFYEFAAVDRPLTERQMDELRGLSSRAEITPTRMRNVYHYGDFRGDVDDLMARYFDAMVYVTSWGTRRLMFRLPRPPAEPSELKPYVLPGVLDAKTLKRHVVVSFERNDEEGGGWIDDAWAEGLLPKLLPLRAQLLQGDLSALYVPWLYQAHMESSYDEDEDEGEVSALREPPPPPGLKRKNAALRALVDLFEIDERLLEAAGRGAPRDAVAVEPDRKSVEAWIKKVPAAQRNAWLADLVLGEAARVEAEVRRGFVKAHAKPSKSPARRRTFAEIDESARRAGRPGVTVARGARARGR